MPTELSREDLIALIEERAEDVCGGKMYDVESKLYELEEDLEASKETIKNLEQSLKQAQSDLQTLSEENKQLKGLVNTLQENKELRSNNELVLLKKEIDVLKKDKPVVAKEEIAKQEARHNDQINKLTQENQGLREELQKVREEDQKKHRRLERLEHEHALLKAELKKNFLKLDDLEQGTYQNSVQIVGLPDISCEDDLKQLLKITKEKLGIKMKANDIEAMTRLGKKSSGKSRNLNVTFKDKSTRERFYLQRKKLIQDNRPRESIYINDRLTKHRQSVLYTCRRQVRARKLHAAWSQGGNVLIRKAEHANVQQINDHEEVRNVLDQGNAENNTMSDRSNEGSTTISHLSDFSFDYYSDI